MESKQAMKKSKVSRRKCVKFLIGLLNSYININNRQHYDQWQEYFCILKAYFILQNPIINSQLVLNTKKL